MNIEFKFQFNTLTFLLGLNLVIFLIAIFIENSVGFDKSLFYLFGGQISSEIYSGSLWLLVTANFFHINVLHFLFNMISLFRLGQLAMFFYDGKKLFITYILGGIGGVGLSYLISLITREDTFSLGASASIFGIVGLLIGGTLRRNRFGRDLPFGLMDLLPFTVIAFAFGFLPGFNINNWAHLGGLLTGILLGVIIPNSLSNSKEFISKLINPLYIITVVIFLVSYLFVLVNTYNLLIV